MFVVRKSQAFGCRRTLCLAGLLTALTASGCQTAAGTGAASGALLGAGIGGLAGHCPGAALVGSALGAGVGTLAGASVDAVREKRSQRAAATEVAIRAPNYNDILNMTQNAVPPQQIVNQIRTSGVVYRLTPEDVINLNKWGVNSAVISEMQATAYRAPNRVVYRSAPAVRPVYVYETPPPVVGVGWGWR